MGTLEERDGVRKAVRVLLEEDRAAGAPKTLPAYQQLFPGFWDVVAEEFEGATAAEEELPVPEPTGFRIGPYRVVREVGRGGMGVVYEAEDTRLPRRVALKVLGPQFAASTQLRLRFQREAELASKIDHPHICTVYEAGEDGGAPYLAMRFVEGRTLADLVAEGRAEARKSSMVTLPALREEEAPKSATGETRRALDRVLIAFEKTARALHAAHEKGLIHRDVKPHNVMVTPEGEPVLLDFGLAREEGGEGHQLTQTGSLMGTPAYMSPEQLMAARITLDRRTDIYSLGVSLYECLTLRLPFEAPTVDRLYQKILATDPEDPRKVNPVLSRDLQVVISTAMEKDRDRRYQSAEDLADELRRVVKGEAIRARPPGLPRRAALWARRNRAAAAVFASLVLGMGGSLAALDSARRTGDDLARAMEQMKDEERVRTLGMRDAMRAGSRTGVRAVLRKVIRDPFRKEYAEARVSTPDGSRFAAIMGRPVEGVAGLYTDSSRSLEICGEDGDIRARLPVLRQGYFLGFFDEGRRLAFSPWGFGFPGSGIRILDVDGRLLAEAQDLAIEDAVGGCPWLLARAAGLDGVRLLDRDGRAGPELVHPGMLFARLGVDGRNVLTIGKSEARIWELSGTMKAEVPLPWPAAEAVLLPGGGGLLAAQTTLGRADAASFGEVVLLGSDGRRRASFPGLVQFYDSRYRRRGRGSWALWHPMAVAGARDRVAVASGGRVSVLRSDGSPVGRFRFASDPYEGDCLDIHPSREVLLVKEIVGGKSTLHLRSEQGDLLARLGFEAKCIDAWFTASGDGVVGYMGQGNLCLWDLYFGEEIVKDPALPGRERRAMLAEDVRGTDLPPFEDAPDAVLDEIPAMVAALPGLDRTAAWRRRVDWAVRSVEGGGAGSGNWLLVKTCRKEVPPQGWAAWWEEQKGRDPVAVLLEGIREGADPAAMDLDTAFDRLAAALPERISRWHEVLSLLAPAGVKPPAFAPAAPNGAGWVPTVGLVEAWDAALAGHLRRRTVRVEAALLVREGSGASAPTVAWTGAFDLERSTTMSLQQAFEAPGAEGAGRPFPVQARIGWPGEAEPLALLPMPAAGVGLNLRIRMAEGRPVLQSWVARARGRTREGTLVARIAGVPVSSPFDRPGTWSERMESALRASLARLESGNGGPGPGLKGTTEESLDRLGRTICDGRGLLVPAHLDLLREISARLADARGRPGSPTDPRYLAHARGWVEFARLRLGDEGALEPLRRAKEDWNIGSPGRVPFPFRPPQEADWLDLMRNAPTPAIRGAARANCEADMAVSSFLWGRDRAGLVEAMEQGEIRWNPEVLALAEREGERPPGRPWGLPLAVLAAVLLPVNLLGCLRRRVPLADRLRPAWMLLALGVTIPFLHVWVAGDPVPTEFGVAVAAPGLLLLALGSRGFAAWLPLLLGLLAAVAVPVSRVMANATLIWEMGNLIRRIPFFLGFTALAALPWLVVGLERAGPMGEPLPATRLGRALDSRRVLTLATLAAVILPVGWYLSLYDMVGITWSESELRAWCAIPPAAWFLWIIMALRRAVDLRAGAPSLPERAWARLRRRAG